MKLTTEQQLQIMDTCEIEQQELDFLMDECGDMPIDEFMDWILQSQLYQDMNEMMDGLGLT